MIRPRFDSGATIWETGAGYLKIEHPRPNVARVTFRGHFSDEFVDPIAAAAERMRMCGRPALVFQDWEGMTNYDMPARVRMLAIGARHLGATERVHFLADSTIVRVAIEVANMGMRKFRVHPGRRSFEAAYSGAIDDRGEARARAS